MDNVRIVMPPQAGATGVAARTEALTRIPASHLRTRPPPPQSVKLELTSRCNYRCAYCEHDQRANKRGEMSWTLYTRLVGELVDAGVGELGLFHIGESFLCDWLPDAIGHAKARGIRYVFLTTNGSLATPEKVRACMEAGLDSLKFSVNDADEAQFRATTQAKGGLFHDAIANLKAARRVRDEGGFPCGLYASSIRYDAAQQERMQPLIAEILPYVDEHYWLPLHVSGEPSPIPCWSLFTEAHVTFDGKLSSCCFDPGERSVMADLTHTSFVDGWNSERFARLREAHLERDVSCTLCEDCGSRR